MTERLTIPTERLMLKLFEESSEGIVITDAKGVIVDANRAFIEDSGYSHEELVGENPRIMKSHVHGDAFYTELWRALLDDGHWRGEIWDRRKDGTLYAKWLSISAVHDDGGRVAHYVAIHQDITNRKQTEEKLEQLAHYDSLTMLPNRLLFLDRLRTTLTRAARNGNQAALMFIDLDRFKLINDTLGHRVGDRLLAAVAQRLTRVVRESDTVARLGGDEFTVILPDVDSSRAGASVARKFIDAFREPFQIESHVVHTTPSIGIAMFPFDGRDVDTLIRASDTAMYEAKREGKNRYRFFSAEMHERAMTRLGLENALRGALDRGEFRLVYQPQVNAVTGDVTGLEALLRWDHPERGEIGPREFLPLAEEIGLAGPIGAWVLDEVCRQGAAWNAAGRPVRIWANLSSRQFTRQDLERVVLRALEASGLPPRLLGLEITEGVMMTEPVEAERSLTALRQLGVRIAVDDFGTGYSSLLYLKRFPIETIKIPREFIENVVSDSGDRSIVEAIVAMSRRLGLRVLAEGVETLAQLGWCRERGIDEIQGFLFARPEPPDRVEAYLERTSLSPTPPRPVLAEA